MTEPGGPVPGAPVRATAVPVSHSDYRTVTQPGGHYARLDAEREASGCHWNDTTPGGFWMVTRYEDVLRCFQDAPAFTNKVTSALNPVRGIDILPQALDGEPHARTRRILNRYFAPMVVRRIEEFAVQRCRELIEELAPRGQCDFVTEFAIRYPTDVFLHLMGLPVSDGQFLVGCVEQIFAGIFGGDHEAAQAASGQVRDYFAGVIAERRHRPMDPDLDLVSRLLSARPGDEPIPESDILTVCVTLVMAGLDTTRSALGYMFWHLARRDGDRRRLCADPELAAAAVEEFIRLYPLVIQAGREVAGQPRVRGLELADGDVVWLGIGSANRDPRKFPAPDQFVLGRDNVSQHLGFGAGPHRCLGMHLARAELAIVLREWHARIPDYRIEPGTPILERGSQLTLQALPLRWQPPTARSRPVPRPDRRSPAAG
jgi:cytochrome P450